MANYAVLDNTDTVVNIIVAETLEIAQLVTNATCVEIIDDSAIVIGSKKIDGKWEFPEGHFAKILSNEEMIEIAKKNKLITE